MPCYLAIAWDRQCEQTPVGVTSDVIFKLFFIKFWNTIFSAYVSLHLFVSQNYWYSNFDFLYRLLHAELFQWMFLANQIFYILWHGSLLIHLPQVLYLMSLYLYISREKEKDWEREREREREKRMCIEELNCAYTFL